MSFEKEFALESAAAIESSEEIVRSVAITADTYAVLNSPRDTGRFVANWLVATGEAVEQTNDSEESKQTASGRVAKEINSAKYTGTFTMFNSLPYAERLNTGWSAQEPTGITDPAASYAESQYSNIVKAIEKKYKVDK